MERISTREQMMKQTQRFLTAEWRDLAMVNFEIDPQLLRQRVPPGTELDTWNGRTFISIVGFRFLRTQVLGMTIPWHRNFEEVNLRFYVRRLSPEGNRRGVVFIKELVPRVAIAWVARCMYNENYIALPMRHETTLPLPDQSGPGSVAYEWQFGSRWNRLVLSVQGMASVPAEDSEEAFITEHYWGYVRQRDGASLEYQVEHPRWKVWRTDHVEFDCTVAELYGSEFVPYLQGPPSSAFVAEGSAIVVHKGVRL